ncbi:MAG TPA: hypothetical protein DDY37_03545 [Legionella sp.]|nr:hypothetical protein [Legionella sp.]
MKANEHKKYIADVLHDHWIVLGITLMPAVIWGWKKGREAKVGQFLKPWVKIGLVSAFSQMKKKLSM